MAIAHAGELAAIGTASCWTLTAVAFEAAGRRVGSLAVNLVRLVIGFGFLSVYGWVGHGRPLPLDASGHAVLWLAVSGWIGFTLGDLCLFRALIDIGARLSVLLMSLVPPMTALIGRLVLGEVLSGADWLGMALTVGGVTWVVAERVPDASGRIARHPRKGILLAVGGALGQAIGLVLSKYGMRSYDPFASTQIRVIAGTIGFALIFTFWRRWSWVTAAVRDRRALALTTCGAFFGPFLGVSLSLVAVQNTRAGVAATLIGLTPVLILPLAIFVRKERVSYRAALGALLAFAGAAVLFR